MLSANPTKPVVGPVIAPGNVPTLAKGPAALVARSITNPLSFVELSVKPSCTDVGDVAAAVKPVGALRFVETVCTTPTELRVMTVGVGTVG